MPHPLRLMSASLACALAASTLSGCHIKQRVTYSAVDALTSGTSSFGSDDDPELIRDSIPFALKTLESLYPETPDHIGLIVALTSGFTQYGYAFVQQDGDLQKFDDYDVYVAKRKRAYRLYLRALKYGQAGLEVVSPGFLALMKEDQDAALATLSEEHVPLIYWTGAAWAAAIATGSSNLTLLADLGRVRALLNRGMELDEDYDTGAFHELFISLDMAPSGGGIESAKKHYERALELSEGKKAGLFLSYAESVVLMEQDKEAFVELVDRALAINPDEYLELRLVNILSQNKAAFLSEHLDDLFGG